VRQGLSSTQTITTTTTTTTTTTSTIAITTATAAACHSHHESSAGHLYSPCIFSVLFVYQILSCIERFPKKEVYPPVHRLLSPTPFLAIVGGGIRSPQGRKKKKTKRKKEKMKMKMKMKNEKKKKKKNKKE